MGTDGRDPTADTGNPPDLLNLTSPPGLATESAEKDSGERTTPLGLADLTLEDKKALEAGGEDLSNIDLPSPGRVGELEIDKEGKVSLETSSSTTNAVAEGLEGVEGGGKAFDDLPDDKFVPLGVVHEPPHLKVTQPHGTFCVLDCRFSVGLPPDGVFDIISDPNNRRVFKNIKEVTYRKVLQDNGDWKLVEVEQLARWQFLVFHGTFPVRVYVTEDRASHTTAYELAKPGFMKRFTGSWKMEPMYADEAGDSQHSAKDDSDRAEGQRRVVGSWVTLHQEVQPAFVPPWPLSSYVRGVSAKIARDMLGDLQREALRQNALQKAEATGEEGVLA